MTHLFKCYDANNNGVLDEGDIVQIAMAFAEIRDWEPGTEEFNRLYSFFNAWWSQSLAFADQNNDGILTLEEFLDYHESNMRDPVNFENTIIALAEQIFNLLDVNGDQTIEKEEWQLLFRGYGLDENKVDELYTHCGIDSDYAFSKVEFLEMLREMCFSEDPNARGNFFFGNFE